MRVGRLLRRSLSLLAALAAVVAGIGWQQGRWQVPDRFDPFAPLVREAPPDWLTPFRLGRTMRDAARCDAFVAGLPWPVERVPDRQTGPGCGFTGAWRISATDVPIGPPVVLACPAVVALAMWQTHTLGPAAAARFGAPVTRLQHVGSYACRNINHDADRPRSRHATAEAFDVTAFELEGGRRISVVRDWTRPGPAADFLRDVHAGACRWFDGVLGPDYNALHADHFHLETGGFRGCR